MSTPFLMLNHSFKTCGGIEAFTSATNFKKCGLGSSLGVADTSDLYMIDGVCILTIILCPLKHRFTVMQ